MIIDCHSHLTPRWKRDDWEQEDGKLIAAADALGINKLIGSIVTIGNRPCEPEHFRQANDWMKDGMRRFPTRLDGYCLVNCGYGREALKEIHRCVETLGFVGVKLYNDYYFDEPVVFPIVELCIELNIPILLHAGYMHYSSGHEGCLSGAERVAALSRRYPNAILICGHIGGGGDWEWAVKASRDSSPNMYLDTSGSVVDEGMIEMAARTIGVDRLLFGCDLSMPGGIGKLRAACLSEQDKRKILGENMQAILQKV